MTPSLITGLVWMVAANVIAMFPSRDHHWRNAYMLIALGIPLLGWITYQNGPVLGLVFLAGGTSILRWPVFHLWRRVKSLIWTNP
ncbi:MAG: DUF2484 family protein [Candidatus Saccharibacteria bacterium]|nr:DUF2484 family protein [Pseudorhodobacter sp.]